MTSTDKPSNANQVRRAATSVALLVALAAVAAVPSAGLGQNIFDSVRTANGFCKLWQAPPGGSNPSDAAYRPCALERIPVLVGAPVIPAPRFGTYTGGSFHIVVNSDGRVDSALTRAWTSGMDSEFHRNALDAIKRWRFEPGIRNGKPVRSAVHIELASDGRNDTLPSKLVWRYIKAGDKDTVRGTWSTLTPLPPFPPETADSVYAAILRELLRTQTVLPEWSRRYCFLSAERDSLAHSHLTRLAIRSLNPPMHSPLMMNPPAPFGCERTPGALRVVLPRVHRTENGRAVIYPTGDFLPSWPSGFEGRSWRNWTSKCVATVPDTTASIKVFCTIEPQHNSDEMRPWVAQLDRPYPVPPPLAYKDGDSLRVTVFATTRGAYRVDTLRSVVRTMASLKSAAVLDSNPPCGGWQAFSSQASGELLIVNGDPTGWLHITDVTKSQLPNRRSGAMRCGPQEPRMSAFSAFLLGGVGDRVDAPITLCYSSCARTYVIDPARHTLAQRPEVTVRLSDLRPDSRTGDQLILRVSVDPLPPGLAPLLVVRFGNRPPSDITFPKAVGANIWQYGTIYGDGYPSDTEVLVYLVVR